MINSRRINAVPLFKRKVSSFLADTLLANTEEGIGTNTREKYGILPSFDNYSGIECHAFIYFLPDISSLPVFRRRNRTRAIPPARSHWRGQCSIMHSINIKSRSFRIGSRNDALLHLWWKQRFVISLTVILDSCWKFSFWQSCQSIFLSHYLFLEAPRKFEDLRPGYFSLDIYFMKDVCSDNRSHERMKAYIQIRDKKCVS